MIFGIHLSKKSCTEVEFQTELEFHARNALDFIKVRAQSHAKSVESLILEPTVRNYAEDATLFTLDRVKTNQRRVQQTLLQQ